MQKHKVQTQKMLLATEEEIFTKTVASNHPFRELSNLVNFSELAEPLRQFLNTQQSHNI